MSHPAPYFRWPTALLLGSILLVSGCGGSSSEPAPVVPEVINHGQLNSATLINTIAVADIATAVLSPDTKVPGAIPVYPVTSYRLTYVTTDGQGKEIVASGLVSVPVKAAGARSPVISYQHATIFKDAEAPSNNVVASEPPLILASLGYIVVAADYVGYGASRTALHPYLLSAPSAAAVVDLMTAAKTWRQAQSVVDNGQLYLVGYSEGGYATMAAHRALQATNSPHLAQLVSSVPGAGPYHVGVTLDMMLQRVRDENVLLATLISPGLLSTLSPTLSEELRRLIMQLVVPIDADVSFQTTFLDNFLADDTAAIERDSNVHDWKPEAPVRMYHGRDDETVPYEASSRTLLAMLARGATAVTLTDCTATPSSHSGCVPPYFTFVRANLAATAKDL